MTSLPRGALGAGKKKLADVMSDGVLPITRRLDVLIIGAGPSGLSAAIKLKEQGVTDTLILDRASRIGGTWAMNDYPGLRCDVPSELYSLGYAPNPNWSRTYAPQAEIRQYLDDIAQDFGVAEHIQLHTEVVDARWMETDACWAVTTAANEVFVAKVLVAAPGFIGEPEESHFPGQKRFKGTIFHSAKWNYDHDLSGERVAVIGCGASAIQFLPAIQPQVKRLISFQRTPAWVLPKPDVAMPKAISRLFARLPQLQSGIREAGLAGLETSLPVFMHEKLLRAITHPLGRFNINRSVSDPVMRKKLTPTFTLGCKRPLFSNDWYKALVQPNVELVFQGLQAITETGVVAADGTEYAVDTILFGTGYAVEDPKIYRILKGAHGQSLADAWQGSPRAYQGLAVHGFPNMFLMLGPNSHSVQGSVMWTCEQQAVYVARAVTRLLDEGFRRFEVKQAVQDDFKARIDKRLARLPIRPDVCHSYYLDSAGRNRFVWPEFGMLIKQRLHHPDLTDYDLA